MKLGKEARTAAQTARRRALQAHFTGDGWAGRALAFVGQGLRASGAWFAKGLLCSSWALVCLVLIAFNDGEFFPKLHAWMAAMPAEQLQGVLLSLAWKIAVQLAQIATFLGFVEQVLHVANMPAHGDKQTLAA